MALIKVLAFILLYLLCGMIVAFVRHKFYSSFESEGEVGFTVFLWPFVFLGDVGYTLFIFVKFICSLPVFILYTFDNWMDKK